MAHVGIGMDAALLAVMVRRLMVLSKGRCGSGGANSSRALAPLQVWMAPKGALEVPVVRAVVVLRQVGPHVGGVHLLDDPVRIIHR